MNRAAPDTLFTVSRGEIADLTGVRPPAVSNWARRHPAFPKPVILGSYAAVEVAAWLDGRPIPTDVRLSGEPEGTTYGARFRARLAQQGRPLPQTDPVEDAATQLLRSSQEFLNREDRVTVLLLPL